MESRYYHVTGLILRHYSAGEHDRRVVFLAPGLGKIIAKARGAKKITSPFISRLSPLNVCELLLYKTPKDSWTIVQCQTEKNFPDLQSSYATSLIALSVIEIAFRCSQEGHSEAHTSDGIYRITIETLDMLNDTKDESKHELIFQTFQLQVLDILGILPSFSTCINCHKKINIEELKGWNPVELRCGSCPKIERNSEYEYGMNNVIFENQYLKLVNYLRKNSLKKILPIKFEMNDSKTLNQMLQIFWNAQSFSTYRQ